MKKMMVIMVGVLSIASIFIVVFFGVLPFTKDKDIYCDYIAMNLQTIMHNDEHIIDVSKRPEDKDIKLGDDWFDNNYDYRIRIKNSNYFFDSMNGELNLHCEAKTNKVGKLVSDPKLHYYCYEPINYTEYLYEEKSQEGIIYFKKDSFKSTEESALPLPFTYYVISNDAHKKSINIRIQVARIK